MDKRGKILWAWVTIFSTRCVLGLNTKQFPESFVFGVASSAYQVEGAWNESGKGENIWDYYTHEYPDRIPDSSNGDIACDSYHNYKEDVSLIKNLGVDFYRFSFSWSRILPNGFPGRINPDGIRYYNDLINELVSNGIKPMVTLYHWDIPLNLQRMGGWTNPILIDIFVDYARIAFENFGDRVPYWVTFNSDCDMYGQKDSPPLIGQPGISEYMCAHNQLRAHAKVYRMYQKEFATQQKGKIGITVDPRWHEPKTNSKEDVEAAERARQFYVGWMARPLYHKDGDYHQIVKDRVALRSKKEGFARSRLPNFTAEEVQMIKGSSDFFGMNVYTAYLAKDISEEPVGTPSRLKDARVEVTQDEAWPQTSADWLRVVPASVRRLLKWIKDNYNNPPIMITENGFADTGGLEDLDRVDFYKSYLSAVLDAIHEDKVNVIGYTAWSLLDNFEWWDGYTQKFGLYQVDFADPNRKRTPKRSARIFKQIVAERRLEDLKVEL